GVQIVDAAGHRERAQRRHRLDRAWHLDRQRPAGHDGRQGRVSAPGRGGVWAKIPQYHRDSFQRALRKGVKIAFGTDAGGFAWDAINEAKEFEYETQYGMTPMQAIQTATRSAADLLGMSDQIGTIEAGKL